MSAAVLPRCPSLCSVVVGPLGRGVDSKNLQHSFRKMGQEERGLGCSKMMARKKQGMREGDARDCKGGREGATAACEAAAPLRAGAGGRRGWAAAAAAAAGCQKQGLFFECKFEQGGGNSRIRNSSSTVYLFVPPMISSWNRTAHFPDRLTFAPRLPSRRRVSIVACDQSDDDPFLCLVCERAKVTPREIQTKALKTTIFWF